MKQTCKIDDLRWNFSLNPIILMIIFLLNNRTQSRELNKIPTFHFYFHIIFLFFWVPHFAFYNSILKTRTKHCSYSCSWGEKERKKFEGLYLCEVKDFFDFTLTILGYWSVFWVGKVEFFPIVIKFFTFLSTMNFLPSGKTYLPLFLAFQVLIES